MTDIATALKECHRIVWDARKELEPYWPTPTTEDALLFAFTELGEAVDAHLRSKPEYARNRDKDLSVLDELADVALMTLTAYGNEWVDSDERDGGWDEWQYAWRFYISDMAKILDIHEQYGDDADSFLFDWRWYAITVVEKIATHPGMDLPTRLTQRLERIKAKRMPGDFYADLEAAWPSLEPEPNGVDIFREKYGAPTGEPSQPVDDKRATC